MAQWKEIYMTQPRYVNGPEVTCLCKVPSNSLFYDRTHVITEIANTYGQYPHPGTGFYFYQVDYKNTAISEHMDLKFDSCFNKAIKLNDAGDLIIHIEILKSVKQVNLELEFKTYTVKLNDYLKEQFGADTKKTVYTTEFVNSDCEFLRNYVKDVLLQIDEYTIQYYHKYLNSNMEFDIEYMDIIASTKEHLSQCGLVFVVEEHETKGRHVIIRASKNDYVNIYTEPCTLEGGNGSLVDLMKFLGIDFGIEKQTKVFKSFDDMFGFINTFADLYKLYKNSLDTTFSGIFDCFVKPAEVA